MNDSEQRQGGEVEEGRFESLIAELSARLIQIPEHELLRTIEDAQHIFCHGLDVDCCALFERGEAEAEKLVAIHVEPGADSEWLIMDHSPPSGSNGNGSPVQGDGGGRFARELLGLKSLLPVCQKPDEILVVEDVASLGSQVGADPDPLESNPIKSVVIVPLVAGRSRLGTLAFADMRQERAWSAAAVKWCGLAANVFALALVWKRSEQALKETQALLASTAQCTRTGLWSIDLGNQRVWLTRRVRELFEIGPEQELTSETFLRLVWPEDHGRLLEAAQKVLQTGEDLRLDFRIRVGDKPLRWISAWGQLHRGSGSGPGQLVGAVADITEQKQAEERLGEIKRLKEQLQAERDYLKAEITVSQSHGEIIGCSPAMRRVLQQVEQVAVVDCPVLVSGETGTGKELVAQEIHRLSARHDRAMVLVNCAALPSALVESELFGRERGAYTGAMTAQVGRFEIADGSTIFLDEVGELSLEVQAKMLRVLQQGEFQRLGSPKTHKVEVRVIAATNRDLAQDVRKGRFREDLYYRLKVFPIAIPPLRDRPGDIPILVFAFVEEFSNKMGKKITRVPRKAMEALQQYQWPGNVRELRNVIEHSVILSSGDLLKLSGFGDAPARELPPVTLAEVEREHITRILESTGWRIKGPHGAAHRLGLQPSTLYSRMQKLAIPHRHQKDEMLAQG